MGEPFSNTKVKKFKVWPPLISKNGKTLSEIKISYRDGIIWYV